jgi:hypothetical protein
MNSREALRRLADVTSTQWGLVTSAQAAARGVGRLELSRLTQSGHFVRLAKGVYKDSGAPGGSHLELRAAWLSTDPPRTVAERLDDGPAGVVVCGESATRLHGIGDLRADRHEFNVISRRQSQRPDIKYRQRSLVVSEVTIREGLPVTTVERTLADLVADRHDLSLVADVLADAVRQGVVNLDRLALRLGPLAERNGHERDDGDALLTRLLRIRGLDRDDIVAAQAALRGVRADNPRRTRGGAA